MGESMLTYKDITKITGITVSALRKRLSLGTMPEPDMRHGASPVWNKSTLADWLRTAHAGRGKTD